MSKDDCTIVFQDVVNRDPVFTGRFHTNILAVVFSKPITQLIQPFGKGRKASLLILRTIVGISNTDTGIDPGFVDIKSTAIEFQDFKRQVTTS